MENENITSDGQLDASQLNAASPEGAVGNESKAEGLSLEEINKQFGKTFPDLPTALKSLKDTVSYAGKRKEDMEKEIFASIAQNNSNDELKKELESIRKDMFYKDNPDYAPLRKIIENMGNNPSEVTSRPEFKEIFEKVKGYDNSQKLRTVLESNPRLAASKDNLSKAADLKRQGAKSDDIESLVARAVLDTIE